MRPSRFPVLWFFVLTYVLQGVGQCVHFYVMHRLVAQVPRGASFEDTPLMTWMPYAYYLTNVGPSLAGLLLTVFLYGFPGLRRLTVQLSPLSVGGAWLLLAVCLVVLLPENLAFVSLVALVIALCLHGPRRWLLGQGWPILAVCLFLPLVVAVIPLGILATFGASVPMQSWQWSEYLYGAVLGGGFLGAALCEEIGWRGFALPHLQRRYSALVSSLIIGLAWAVWHWPNFLLRSDSSSWQLLALVPLTMAICVVWTWVYNSTGGSLFAIVVLHGATYIAPNLHRDSEVAVWGWVIQLLLFAVMAVGLVWRYGAANLSLRDRVVAQPPDNCVNRSGESAGI